MHYKTKEAAVNKYGAQFKDGATREELTNAVAADEKKFDPTEVDEIVDAILDSGGPKKPVEVNEPKPSENGTKKKTIAELQAEHPTMKWFDEFHVRIQKKNVRNVLAGRDETIITGWEIVKKLHPKFVEPRLATETNRFANGYVTDQVGLYLVLKDTMKTGDVISYKTWADEMGIDPKSDINQLLNS